MNETPDCWGWSDLVGRRVGIWGLGVEGRANLARATTLGLDVTLVDSGQAGTMIDGHRVEGDAEALTTCEVVVKSPGISRYQDLVERMEAAGIAVVGGHGLWLCEADASKVAAVTGTKGKSTTVSVVGQLFAGLGIDGAIGGNIGEPAYDPRRTRGAEFWCVELSSYQVADLEVRPMVVAVTSLSPDHVEWHRSLDQYYADKLSLATLPVARSVDRGEEIVLASAVGGDLVDNANRLGPTVTWVEPDDRAVEVADAFGLRGIHNQANVALALALVEALVGERFEVGELVAAAEGYAHLGSRLTTVRQVDGVEFVDDCLSTNTLPTMAALDVFADRPTALIAGGFDRGIDYEPLGRRVASAPGPLLVLCLDAPDNGQTVATAIEAAEPGSNVTVVLVDSMGEAVEQGYTWCRRHGGGVVLLSPAAPTRGQALGADGQPIITRYPNYGAKAKAFTSAADSA